MCIFSMTITIVGQFAHFNWNHFRLLKLWKGGGFPKPFLRLKFTHPIPEEYNYQNYTWLTVVLLFVWVFVFFCYFVSCLLIRWELFLLLSIKCCRSLSLCLSHFVYVSRPATYQRVAQYTIAHKVQANFCSYDFLCACYELNKQDKIYVS